MNYIQINIKEVTIKLYGSTKIIENEKTIIEKLELTGNEKADRLIIQKCIDYNKLKSDILYGGNTVYSFEKIIRDYRKIQKSGSLDNLTNSLYEFFIYACGDIAHYNIWGFRAYYNYSFRELENRLLKYCWVSDRISDINRIFKELKIGREYFEQRDCIDTKAISA